MITLFPNYGFILAAILCFVNGIYNLATGYYGWSMISCLLAFMCVTGYKWYKEAIVEAKDRK